MKEETIIRISVRSLVEFILREGDIDNRVSGSMEKDAMLLGGKYTAKYKAVWERITQRRFRLKYRCRAMGWFCR